MKIKGLIFTCTNVNIESLETIGSSSDPQSASLYPKGNNTL